MKGWQIRVLREDLELTQVKLAKRLGVHVTTLNRWENDKTKPIPLALDKLRSIAEKQGIKIAKYERMAPRIRKEPHRRGEKPHRQRKAGAQRQRRKRI
jgi:putative transcriptional regulator